MASDAREGQGQGGSEQGILGRRGGAVGLGVGRLTLTLNLTSTLTLTLKGAPSVLESDAVRFAARRSSPSINCCCKSSRSTTSAFSAREMHLRYRGDSGERSGEIGEI